VMRGRRPRGHHRPAQRSPATASSLRELAQCSCDIIEMT
jgi:hypothetical protein